MKNAAEAYCQFISTGFEDDVRYGVWAACFISFNVTEKFSHSLVADVDRVDVWVLGEVGG